MDLGKKVNLSMKLLRKCISNQTYSISYFSLNKPEIELQSNLQTTLKNEPIPKVDTQRVVVDETNNVGAIWDEGLGRVTVLLAT